MASNRLLKDGEHPDSRGQGSGRRRELDERSVPQQGLALDPQLAEVEQKRLTNSVVGPGCRVNPAFLALDIGSSTLRVLLGDPHRGVLGAASAPMRYVRPDPADPFSLQVQPDDLFAEAGRLVRRVLAESGIEGHQVAGIGVTSQRQGSVFLDAHGKELYAGPNMDLRATMEGAAMDEEMGTEIYKVTGHLPSLMFTLARLRWFRSCQPREYDSIASVLAIAAWMAYRMTGTQSCEPSLAGEIGLLDVGSVSRCEGLCQRLGVDSSLFPPMIEAGHPVGNLKRDVAGSWGLSPDTPVTIAGPDTQCGLVGMGVSGPGTTGLIAGWSCTLQMVTEKPRWDDRMRTWVGCMNIPGLWMAESNLGDGGYAYNWVVRNLVNGDYAAAEDMACRIEPGAGGARAFLGPGPESMPSAGMRAGGFMFYTPLSFQEVTHGQLVRASLENLAYSARANLETLEEVSGQKADALSLGGGLSRSRLFASVLANVLGRDVRRSLLPEASTWGALLAAAVAAGEYPDLASASREACCETELVPSSQGESAEYQDHFQRWREAYYALQEVA